MVIKFLEELEQCFNEADWQTKASNVLKQYKKELFDTNDISLIDLYIKVDLIVDRNRLLEGKRLIKRELENFKGLTEINCKMVKINNNWCEVCENYNCNLNDNQAT